jgi:hypothetical protein
MAPKDGIPTYILGIGLAKFIKPRKERLYLEIGYEAGGKATLDAHINYDDVETGLACYCTGHYFRAEDPLPVWHERVSLHHTIEDSKSWPERTLVVRALLASLRAGIFPLFSL